MRNLTVVCLMVISMFLNCGRIATAKDPKMAGVLPQDLVIQGTPQAHAIQLATVTAAEEDLNDVNKSWQDCNTEGVKETYGFQVIPPGWNAGGLMGYAYGDGTGAGDPSAGDVNFSVYICDWLGGAKTAYKGVASVGSERLSHNPATGTTAAPNASCNAFFGTADTNYAWIDTVTAATDNPTWKRAITFSGAAGGETGSNIASGNIDFFGGYLICIKTTSMSNVTSVTWVLKQDF